MLQRAITEASAATNGRDGWDRPDIAAALPRDRDVITEKPITTDLDKLASIRDAPRTSSRSVTVAFDDPYTPPPARLKGLPQSGFSVAEE